MGCTVWHVRALYGRWHVDDNVRARTLIAVVARSLEMPNDLRVPAFSDAQLQPCEHFWRFRIWEYTGIYLLKNSVSGKASK